MNWDDLRHFAAVARHGGLSGAARVLGSSPQTLGRRVASLEAELGTALFVRHPGGYRLTSDGAALFAESENVEEAMARLRAKAAGFGHEIAGLVRIAAPETLATHLLLPSLKRLLDQHPALRVEVTTSVALVGMTRGEADIALRLVRPEQGALTVRRVGEMAQALYAAPGLEPDLTTARLVGWAVDHDLPAARWLRRVAGREPDILLNHLAAHEAAIRSGLGIGVLPCFLSNGLVRVQPAAPEPEPLWLVTQQTDTPAERVRVVYDEVIRIIAQAADSLNPGWKSRAE